MSRINTLLRLLKAAIPAISLVISGAIAQLNIASLLSGGFVASWGGMVTFIAAAIAVICVIFFYFFNKPKALNSIQLRFYQRKFLLSVLMLFVLSSSGALIHFQPVVHQPKGAELPIGMLLVFCVYLPTVIWAYTKYWRCPKCGARPALGFSLMANLPPGYSRKSLKEHKRLRAQFERKSKTCQQCKTLLIPNVIPN